MRSPPSTLVVAGVALLGLAACGPAIAIDSDAASDARRDAASDLTPPSDAPPGDDGPLLDVPIDPDAPVPADDVPDATPDAAPDAGDPLAARRARCEFRTGARVLDTLGFTAADRMRLPIDHVIVLMEENRSFDHYLGMLGRATGAMVDGFPATYRNRTSAGTVAPAHATTTCISPDTPHAWSAMHNSWNGGAMDGFYLSAAAGGNDGHRAIAWYDQRDLPFYYWLYATFAISDRMFSSVLGPTWPNRDFLYAATSDGVMNTFERTIPGVRTVFDALTTAGVRWGVYTDGTPRQDCLGWTSSHAGVANTAAFYTALRAGSLPPVAFIDPSGASQDEHPSNDVQRGEAWVRQVVTAVMASPLWPRTALIVTYDEAGGFFDHVPPPTACAPSTNVADAQFNRLGIRIPTVVVSPWARPGFVSHEVHQTTSITRLIELVFDLPALTTRDANSDALLDLFDFTAPHFMTPPGPAPAAGTGGCP